MNKQAERAQIRLMKEEDLPALEWDGEYSRYRRIYREVYRNSQKGITRPYVAETVTDGIIAQVFLTKREPSPEYSPYSCYGFISSFRVKPAFRGQGLGSRMLAVCEDGARRMYLKEVFLNCAAENIRAKVFYERHGYQVQRINSGEWTYIDPEGRVVSEFQTACLMKKTLWSRYQDEEQRTMEREIDR